MVVVDTSVLLAIVFDESHANWAVQELARHEGAVSMSTINLTETLIRIRDRQPDLADSIEAWIFRSSIRFVPPDVEQARIAAEARLRYPLNLGDCFVYALAVVESSSILAIDRDFRAVDRPWIAPPSENG